MPKEYEVGIVSQISFNPSNNEQVYFSFKNGLVLILEFKDALTDVSVEAEVSDIKFETPKDDVPMDETINEKQLEKCEENVSPTTDDQVDTEKEGEMVDKSNEIVGKTDCEGKISETEKVLDATSPKSEDKQDNTKLEETTCKIPKILNYIVRNKINSICWLDNKITIASDDSDPINVFEITGDGTKLAESQPIITLVGWNYSNPIFN